MTQPSIRERLGKELAPEFVEHVNRPAIDRERALAFAAHLRVNYAHVLMLRDQRLLTADQASQLLATLRSLGERGVDALPLDYTQEDLYSVLEPYVIRAVGADVGGRMHTARSRNDLYVTVWKLVLREQLLDLDDRLVRLRTAVLDLARRERDTVMPGFTHGQHAQPTTLGHYLVGFADVLARDWARLTAAYGRVNRSPLGAGALTTTSWPIDREATARWLGFDGLVENAYDATGSRDDVAEAGAGLAILATNLSRLCQDFWTWSTLEFGYLELDDAYAKASSIMPQKRNPSALEHVKGTAAHVLGDLVAMLAAQKNTAFGDVWDAVNLANPPLWDALAKTAGCLDLVAGVVASSRPNRALMRRRAASGYGTMTDLADAIVQETGLPFRQAHNVVGRVVREALADGIGADGIDAARIDRAAQTVLGRPIGLRPEALARALDPEANVRARTVRGGPAPAELQRQLDAARAALAADGAWLEQARSRVAEADAELKRQLASVGC